MTSKKYILLAGFISLLATSEMQAQDMSGSSTSMTRGGGYDLSDSSLIPKSRRGQAADYAAGQFDYPAKPRSQWEIGINGGLLNVSGDVRSKTPFNQPQKLMNTLGWGLSVRKAWGYVFSTRLFYNRGIASGYNHEASYNYWGHFQNPYYNAGYHLDPKNKNVFYSYKTNIQELSLQMVMSLNNLKFHKARTKFGGYLFGGAGVMTYRTRMDMFKGDTTNYEFGDIKRQPNSVINNIYKQRKDVNKQLLAMFDDEYETNAEEHPNRGKAFKGSTVRPIFNIGLGMQYRLTKRVSLQLEDKMTITMDDLIDGYRWQEAPYVEGSGVQVSSAMTRDFDNINYFSLGLNVNLGGKSVDPLWWMNPLDFGYNALRRQVTPPDSKCDKDADGDGISDCFDRCPNTPGGVSVDSHGCPFDTDGDGVPDYKDKQLITPTECQQNVDADGVGKCPDPECCKNGGTPPPACSDISSGMVNFAPGTSKLSTGAMSQLNSLAAKMRSNPNCKVVVIGCGNTTKIEQQRSWDRVNSVINYMVDKQNIDRDRFIFQYGTSCDANSVEYRSAAQGEEGPSNLPPPHPNLRRN